jgi:leucine dehydrogenase
LILIISNYLRKWSSSVNSKTTQIASQNGLFAQVEQMGHEQVIYCHDKLSGLKAIIGIHDTTLGPALGGTRLWNYDNEEEALTDVLRLSRGMTYKAACAGLSLGGGKAVIIAKPEQKSEAMFRAFGRFVNSLQGRYITAEDVNTNVNDMNNVRLETSYVTGIAPALGGSGDPSPVTALGVFSGLKAAVEHRLGKKEIKGLKVAVQGVGNVGKYLCEYLHAEGAELVVSDIHAERCQEMAKRFGAKIVVGDEIYSQTVDVFSPNALGAILNSETIPKIKAQVIAGGSNNQLKDEVIHGNMLREFKITYSPDYVINAGGLINVYNELIGYNREKALFEAKNIYQTMLTILQTSEKESITSHEAASRVAERRIQSIKQMKTLSTVSGSPVGRMMK